MHGWNISDSFVIRTRKLDFTSVNIQIHFWGKCILGQIESNEVRNKIELQKMTSHFKLLTQKFLQKFFFRVIQLRKALQFHSELLPRKLNFNFFTFELLTRSWKIKSFPFEFFTFHFFTRSWKIKSFTSSYWLDW